MAEQNLVCKVEDKDLGYLLKNFGEKGWGLFNLQTMDIVMADKRESGNNTTAEVKGDAFSSMLSTVVNDPSIKQAEPLKEEPKPQLEKKETKKVAEQAKEKAVVENAEPQQAESLIVKSKIIKKSAKKKAEGNEIVYIDVINGKADTIRVLIPVEKIVSEAPKAEIQKEDKPAVKDQQANDVNQEIEKPKENIQEEKKTELVKKDEKKKEEKFLPIEMPNPNTGENKPEEKKSTQNTTITPTEPVEKKQVIANSDCKSLASDEDFLKLRKKMAGETKEDAMLSLARKSFKSKCYTTEQVKNLSVLFLKDLERYNFFDLAYPYVSDSQNYSTLESQLTDTYYISRFKAMIRH